jgi:3-hydroxybutyryl-CoA dehydrogenase
VVVGVIGAGTMGAGIAQLAIGAGAETFLVDPVEGAVERGEAGIRKGLERWAAKGRAVDPALLHTARELGALRDCDIVVEAAPERLELKHELFGTLSREVVSADCVLASNTSSVPITAIARVAERPERVVGMHFFNPAPVMKLVEVIAGLESSAAALARTRELGEAMGKSVIDCRDGPGFLVNRCNRPFGLEALKLLQDGIADVPTIDRIVRAAGFRMGPFELQDLVGIDTGFEVSKSFAELGFGEPRWRPSPLSAQMVAAGRFGRKTGRGWYDYDDGAPHRPDDPQPPTANPLPALVVGNSPLATHLRNATTGTDPTVAFEAGEAVPAGTDATGGTGPRVAIDCDGSYEGDLPVARLIDAAPLAGRSGCGFFTLATGGAVELVEGPGGDVARAFFESLGRPVVEIGDCVGGVSGRMVCQVINESCFAVQEGVGSPADVDAGMQLGMNHPRGPFAWLDAIGAPQVLRVLDGLRAFTGEERYRAAPWLRLKVARG